MSKKSKASKVILYVLVLLVVVAIIGVIVKFTNGFTTEFTTFYVTVDGKDVVSSGSDFRIGELEPLHVDVKYTFNDLGSEAKGYSVKIVPNVNNAKDFDFYLDGNAYSFKAENDLTNGFEILYGEDYFEIKPKGGLTKVLQAVYPNNEVVVLDNEAYSNMFTLIVTSYNGESQVMLNFGIGAEILGITLDKETIVF